MINTLPQSLIEAAENALKTNRQRSVLLNVKSLCMEEKYALLKSPDTQIDRFSKNVTPILEKFKEYPFDLTRFSTYDKETYDWLMGDHLHNIDIGNSFIESKFVPTYSFVDITTLAESLDSKLETHDVTDIVHHEHPEIKKQNNDAGISHYKVEYHMPTDETFTTYHRAGAWEIHHQRGNVVGVKLNNQSPPMKFISHVHHFIKEKIDNGEKVRISAPHDLIHSYHAVATKFSKKHNIKISNVVPSVDPHNTGMSLHEFMLYPETLNESTTIFGGITTHAHMQYIKNAFGNTLRVLEYEETLRKQGHHL